MGSNKDEYENAKQTLLQADEYLSAAQGGSTRSEMEAARMNIHVAREELAEARENYQRDPNG